MHFWVFFSILFTSQSHITTRNNAEILLSWTEMTTECKETLMKIKLCLLSFLKTLVCRNVAKIWVFEVGGYPTLSPNISGTKSSIHMKFQGSITNILLQVWCKNEVSSTKTSVSSGLTDLIMAASANHGLFTSSTGAKGRTALIGNKSILQVT